MSKAVKITNGLWFSVPLRDGGFAPGLVARSSPNRGVKTLFCYFFPHRYVSPPTLLDMAGFSPEDAILLAMAGGMDLAKNRWPIMGKDEQFSERDWPMPSFARKDVVSGNYRVITYAEDDPSVTIREELCSEDEARKLPEDGVCGGGAVELLLTHLLKEVV